MSPATKAAQRARSLAVAHSCPAGPIARVSWIASGSSTSACGWTAYPVAKGATGSAVVRCISSGARISSVTTSAQE